ncbi:MAG: TetR/AcrR family transcriptional regulator [Rhodoblastus sp.]
MSANLTKEHISEVVNERRRQQRAVDKRERILEAAFEEFAERGFEGASTRSVATKAGVQHPLVTYHFGSKEGLWKAVVTNASFNFSEYFKEHIESEEKDPVARLMRIQEQFIRFAAANPHFHWLMSHEGNRESDRLTWLVEERVRNYFDQIAELIRVAQKRGRYIAGDPYHLQYLFIGAVTRLYMLSAEVKQVTGRSPHSKPFVNEHIRACLSLFFRDPPAAPAKARRVTRKSART